MVQITKEAIIITLPHPRPEEALLDLQLGIIHALQYQLANYEPICVSDVLLDGNYLLLELLEATLYDDAEAEKERSQMR